MTLTLEELCEKLIEQVDPDLLVEELELSSEDLVNRFQDVIQIRYSHMIKLIED